MQEPGTTGAFPNDVLAPRRAASAHDVARHYDELDCLYRDIWGEHLHHGLWEDRDDQSPVDQATARLLERITTPLDLSPGQHLVDIGCGYGATALQLAARHGVRVTGFTLSKTQAEIGQRWAAETHAPVEIIAADWLSRDRRDERYDAALAIESLAHMTDKQAFFDELFRTLRPGARAAIACWLTAPDLSMIESALMRKVCRDGRLTGIGTMDSYLRMAREAGFNVIDHRDLSEKVERTWWIILARAASALVSRPKYLRLLLQRRFRERIFAFTIPLLMFAYRTGAMRYGGLWLEKPGA